MEPRPKVEALLVLYCAGKFTGSTDDVSFGSATYVRIRQFVLLCDSLLGYGETMIFISQAVRILYREMEMFVSLCVKGNKILYVLCCCYSTQFMI
jgi:hypothetical protein